MLKTKKSKTSQMNITVTQHSQYGKGVMADGKWLSFSQYSESPLSLDMFPIGGTFTVNVTSGKDGKTYIESLVGRIDNTGPKVDSVDTVFPEFVKQELGADRMVALPPASFLPLPKSTRTDRAERLSLKDLVIIRQNAASNAARLLANLANDKNVDVTEAFPKIAALSEEFVLRGLDKDQLPL